MLVALECKNKMYSNFASTFCDGRDFERREDSTHNPDLII